MLHHYQVRVETLLCIGYRHTQRLIHMWTITLLLPVM
jgi:hypothetical protein